MVAFWEKSGTDKVGEYICKPLLVLSEGVCVCVCWGGGVWGGGSYVCVTPCTFVLSDEGSVLIMATGSGESAASPNVTNDTVTDDADAS
jgi:hypothetical protein